MFADILATLPAIDAVGALHVIDAHGHTVHTIRNAAGTTGSLRVYHALAQQFGGQLGDAAVQQGLQWFAEHVADARLHPGRHPNIDLLLQQAISNKGYRLEVVYA